MQAHSLREIELGGKWMKLRVELNLLDKISLQFKSEWCDGDSEERERERTTIRIWKLVGKEGLFS